MSRRTIVETYEASKEWPTQHPKGVKIQCPDCGKTGYPGGRWIEAHAEHMNCQACNARVTRKGLAGHMSRCPAKATMPV